MAQGNHGSSGMAARAALAARMAQLRQENVELRRMLHCVSEGERQQRRRRENGASQQRLLLLRIMVRMATSWDPAICRARRLGILPAEASPADASAMRESLRAVVSRPAIEAECARLCEACPAGRLVRRAALLVAEYGVLLWLYRGNERGVAPSCAAMLDCLRQHWPAAGRDAAFHRFFFRLRHREQARKSWAKRFRSCWGVTWRRLPARPEVPPDVESARVRE